MLDGEFQRRLEERRHFPRPRPSGSMAGTPAVSIPTNRPQDYAGVQAEGSHEQGGSVCSRSGGGSGQRGELWFLGGHGRGGEIEGNSTSRT